MGASLPAWEMKDYSIRKFSFRQLISGIRNANWFWLLYPVFLCIDKI